MKNDTFNYKPLYRHYAQIIIEMPAKVAKLKKRATSMKREEFTSHEFILCLAQKYQADYIHALYYWRAKAPSEPFRMLHGILAQRLHHETLIRWIREVPDDLDIFDNPAPCAVWGRVP
jgi:hypothetical protein